MDLLFVEIEPLATSMKKIFLLLLPFSLQIVYSQDANYIQQPAVGVHVFLNAFSYNDSLHTSGKFNYRRAGIALSYLKGLTPRTDLNINLAGSFLAFPGIDKGEQDKQLLLEADATLREKLFPGRRLINPFLQAGAGISRYPGSYGVYIPAGLGLQVNLPGEAFLLIHSQYRIPVTSTQSGHFYGSIGIAGIIGKKKSPKRKKVTELPVRPAPVSRPGKDTDGDGIVDSLDACPLVAGLQAYQGCPMPAVSPTLLQKDIREKVTRAAKNVFFETDRYKLLPASYTALDEVAGILRLNPLLKLDIEGHTDNTGSPEKNNTLSLRRAKSVLEYLSVRAGIAKERLSAIGYGSARPVTDNNTPEGKALNRRVEFKLKYY